MSGFQQAWVSRPVRAVLWWQAVLTLAAMFLVAYFSGVRGAVSAGLGGAISMMSGFLFAALATGREAKTADDVLVTAFKAEAIKIIFVVVALWLVLAAYKNVVAVGFIGTFIVTILASSMALFVRER